MNIQLKISSENNKEINKIYEAYGEVSKIIVNDILQDLVDDFKDKLQSELDNIVGGIYTIMNIIVRSKIRHGWKRVKEPLVQVKQIKL